MARHKFKVGQIVVEGGLVDRRETLTVPQSGKRMRLAITRRPVKCAARIWRLTECRQERDRRRGSNVALRRWFSGSVDGLPISRGAIEMQVC